MTAKNRQQKSQQIINSLQKAKILIANTDKNNAEYATKKINKAISIFIRFKDNVDTNIMQVVYNLCHLINNENQY